MSKPEKVEIEVSKLRAWIAVAQDGINPSVDYHPEEGRRMLDDAYEVRGKSLTFLRNELNASPRLP